MSPYAGEILQLICLDVGQAVEFSRESQNAWHYPLELWIVRDDQAIKSYSHRVVQGVPLTQSSRSLVARVIGLQALETSLGRLG